jgi:hypothetical protein
MSRAKQCSHRAHGRPLSSHVARTCWVTTRDPIRPGPPITTIFMIAAIAAVMTELHESHWFSAGLPPLASGSLCTFAIKTRQQGRDVTSPGIIVWTAEARAVTRCEVLFAVRWCDPPHMRCRPRQRVRLRRPDDRLLRRGPITTERRDESEHALQHLCPIDHSGRMGPGIRRDDVGDRPLAVALVHLAEAHHFEAAAIEQQEFSLRLIDAPRPHFF